KYQVTPAIISRWIKINLEPNNPSGAKTTARKKVTIGPIDHASCAVPTCAARFSFGDSSAIYVQETGTPAPTAIPVTIVPINNIGKLTETAINSTPTIYSNKS